MTNTLAKEKKVADQDTILALRLPRHNKRNEPSFCDGGAWEPGYYHEISLWQVYAICAATINLRACLQVALGTEVNYY